MTDPIQDQRPPMVVAMHWVSQVTTVGLEMSLPAGLGYWLDLRWGTLPWLVSLGGLLGFGLGMWHLLKMVKGLDRPVVSRGDSPGSKKQDNSQDESP